MSGSRPTAIAAHRGGSLEKPENTLEAFRHAMTLGVEEVEFDVHLTRDGVPVVHHDATLDRMTGSSGAIAAYTFDELRRVPINGTAKAIPSLEEVLGLLQEGPLGLRLELKPDHLGEPYRNLPELVVNTLEHRNLAERTTITSFCADYLRNEAIAAARLPLILLVEPDAFRSNGGLNGLHAVLDIVGTKHFALPIDHLDDELCSAARDRELTVSAFAAHTEPQIRKAFALKLPVITTDRPSLALDLRKEHAG
jgi:glycerophosphoryl diester phosphodiesterase